MHSTRHWAQKGFVSIIALLFLSSVVVFILAQSLSMSGSKSLETQQYFDSVAALALAESGREAALAEMTNVVNMNPGNFKSNCDSYPSRSAVSLGRGTFNYAAPPSAATGTICRIRSRGTVGSAVRTLETTLELATVNGVGGTGDTVNLTLTNPYDVPAVAVFNLAWRRQQNTGGGQATSNCSTCGIAWNQDRISGLNSAGSLGASQTITANNPSASVTQTLSASRNYIEVGLVLGGTSTGGAPVLKGAYTNDNTTTNTSNQTTTTGTVPSGEKSGGGNWCTDADTLVFGVSGRSDNFSAAFSSVRFNTAGTNPQNIALTPIAHFPNSDGSSPNTQGDIFSEIWYTHNPFVRMTVNAAAAGTNTITPTSVASLSNLKVGTILKVYSNTSTRAFTVASVGATSFTVTPALSAALTNGTTICGGICALFDSPASNSADTTFSLTLGAGATQQWAAGFACYSGVDPNKVKSAFSAGLTVKQWHEVISGE